MELSESNPVASLQLLISGVDVSGKPCQQSVTAHDLNYVGARLEGLTYAIAPGSRIDLRYKDLVIAARVIWLVMSGAGEPFRAGVLLLDPKHCPWQNALPHGDKILRFPQRRKADRYKISIGIQILDEADNLLMQSSTSDVGIGGCYMEADSPLKVDTRMKVLLCLGKEKLKTSGVVRAMYPGVGMGIEFLDMGWEQTEQLYKFLELNFRLT
jgi:PilZ domain